jgi:hypothetical protein
MGIVTSIVNKLEEDIVFDSLQIELEDYKFFFFFSVHENSSRLFKLRDELRTDHLNSDRVSLIKICEEYNDVFHLSAVKLLPQQQNMPFLLQQ